MYFPVSSTTCTRVQLTLPSSSGDTVCVCPDKDNKDADSCEYEGILLIALFIAYISFQYMICAY